MKSIIPNLIILLYSFFSSLPLSSRMGKVFVWILSLFAFSQATYALSPDFFASSSVLSSGRWVKIEVKETGIQFISASCLKELGFSDAERVNVYGFGGQILPERLYADMTDDLPILPSIATNEGIYFFGVNTVAWDKSVSYPSHRINPYSASSYYFISDREARRPSLPETDNPAGETQISSFFQRVLHEKDITPPSNSGRVILGEDFKTQPRHAFNFKLKDIIGKPQVKVCFGAKVTNGQSSLKINLNEHSSTSTIKGVSNNDTFMIRQVLEETGDIDENLDIALEYSYSGVSHLAALDYIEIFYERKLRLSDNQLHFYIHPPRKGTVIVENCTDQTQIWDVTDPLRPTLVKHSLEGSSAVFGVPASYGEYVAFNPRKLNNTVAGAGVVRNQDIHSMPAPDLLIISPEAYRSSANDIAVLHEQTDGMKTLVLSPEEIYNEFSSGTPDVTAFRKLLKMWYDRGTASGSSFTRHCLILSRPSYDNKMCTPTVRRDAYPRVPIWQSETGFTETLSFSTDDYIGMLADNPSTLNMRTAEIQVAVGRMPVKSAAEARTSVEKLKKYISAPNLGGWRNNIMVIADDQDNGTHLTQAENVCSILKNQDKGSDFIYEKLYLDAFTLSYSGTGAIYPEAKARMMEKWNDGVMLINYIGHANPKSWGHEQLLTWTDINSMTNRNLPFLYAATCEFLRWDDDAVSGGELLWLNPESGVIGMICPTRSVYITLNGQLNASTVNHLFALDQNDMNLTLGEIMIRGKNGLKNDDNRLRYSFCGDPALRLPIPRLNVKVDAVNGLAADEITDFPVVGSRSTVFLEGRVTDSQGNTLNDFSGSLELKYFDAEKVKTTFGNGSDGVEMSFNDRSTLLASGKVKVTDGKWTSSVIIPSEIENNFSPALVSLYATDSGGREANGSFSKFYIYGVGEEAPEDSEGPKIEEFFINSSAFTDGSNVAPRSMVLARFTDPSGINISDAGIGHNITLTLDNKMYFSDAARFYSPEEGNPYGGTLSYPLSDIEPGEHTLTLTVWDNAHNSSKASLSFNVSADWAPHITRLSTDANPAVSSVNFLVDTDGFSENSLCKIEVFDLTGRPVWSETISNISSSASSLRIPWNLCGSDGKRIDRGIYIYRATVGNPDGHQISKSKRLAVAAN